MLISPFPYKAESFLPSSSASIVPPPRVFVPLLLHQVVLGYAHTNASSARGYFKGRTLGIIREARQGAQARASTCILIIHGGSRHSGGPLRTLIRVGRPRSWFAQARKCLSRQPANLDQGRRATGARAGTTVE